MPVGFSVANVTTTGFDIVDNTEFASSAVEGDTITVDTYPPTGVLGTYTLTVADLDPDSTGWNIGIGGYYLWAGFEGFSGPAAGTNYQLTFTPTADNNYTLQSERFSISISMTVNSLYPARMDITFNGYTAMEGENLAVSLYEDAAPRRQSLSVGDTGSKTYNVIDFNPDFLMTLNTTYVLFITNTSQVFPLTTFSLSPSINSYTFSVTDVSATSFSLANFSAVDEIYIGDTLTISSVEMEAGLPKYTYATYTYVAADFSQSLARAYPLNTFSPSNFTLTSGTHYNLTFSTRITGYITPYTTDLYFLTAPSITIKTTTQLGITVFYKNYTSAANDTLVITSSGSPTITLSANIVADGSTGATRTYLFSDFSPSFSMIINTSYTLTLNYPTGNSTTTTFNLSALGTTPDFTVTNVNAKGFEITNPSNYTLHEGDTLNIADYLNSLTYLYGTYSITSTDTQLNRAYLLSEFITNPSNYNLLVDAQYYLILAPRVAGYFNSKSKSLSYSSSLPQPSITIASQSVTENGFTVSFSNYNSVDGDLIVIMPPSSNSPGINLAANDITGSGNISFLYNAFNPPLETAVNTTYTVTLYYEANMKNVTTTFILNATNTTPTFDVTVGANNEFTISNSSFSVQKNDTLKIRDSTGTTLYASYAFSAGQTLNGTYALSVFTRTPSNFVLGDNVTYKITIAPFVSGYFNSVTNNLSYSPAPPDASITIASQTVTENGFTVSFSNYTSANGDTLVITPPSSSSPSLTLAVNDVTGSGDKAYLYSAFSPSLATAVNTTYTVTLRYSSNTKTATATFVLNATNTTPSFTVIAGKNNEFTISNSTYIVQKNDTLKIRDSTGTTVYASYAFSASRLISGTYALSSFTRTPSNFVLQDNVVYKFILAPYVAGYFNSVTKNLTFSPPSVSISNVAATGFTVRFSNYVSENNDTLSLTGSGITTAPKITYSTSPNTINAPAGTPQTKNYTFTGDFSPSFTLALDTTYTATLRISGGTAVSATTYFTKSSPSAPCFREGSQILCDISGVETYRAIETLRPGTLVKTLTCGLVPIEMIGHTKLKNPGHGVRIQNRLYKCSKANYPTLTEDLYITGCHSILEGYMSETQKEATIVQLGRLFVTEGKYRLMACIDERAMPHLDDAEYTIWHIALENNEYYNNYGVWANGLLVETCSKRYLKELSGMTLVV